MGQIRSNFAEPVTFFPSTTSPSPRSGMDCRTFRSRRWLILLASASFLSGCASDSGIFRVKNPFEEESQAISNWMEHRDDPRETPAPEDSSRFFGPDEDQAPSPYFGMGGEPASPPARKKRRPPSASPSPAPVPTATATAGTASLTSEAPPIVEETPAVMTAPAGPKTGKPCYRCNGKGYRLSSLDSNAEFVTCDACGGTGRR